MSSKHEYKDVLTYIDQYWGHVTFDSKFRPAGWRNRLMHVRHVALPNPAVAANDRYFAGTQWYWDSYFTILGLVVDNKTNLAKGMVDNFCFLYEKFGIIPPHNGALDNWRSQPPYLTRMAWEVFEHTANPDIDWMNHVMETAAHEYEQVWLGKGRFMPELGLSRYHPKHLGRLLTVYESGWDWSERFAKHPQSVVPVDLNAQLYQYEDDLYNWAQQHHPEQAQVWKDRMDKRRELLSQYFWDEKSGFFYDYDSKTKTRRPLKTLAGYLPMWCGAATPEQAARCVEHLVDFEHDFGLANTEKVAWKKRQQWDYPNGWPPHQYLVIAALRRYGFNEQAAGLTIKWLELNSIIFKTTGRLWEKYDVVHGEIGRSGRYPTEPGFAWTNAVFLRLLKDLNEL